MAGAAPGDRVGVQALTGEVSESPWSPPVRSRAEIAGGRHGPPPILAEGHGRFGRDRQHHWRIADASAKEVDSHLRLLVATGAISSSAATAALERFDAVRAMVWRLVHPTA